MIVDIFSNDQRISSKKGKILFQDYLDYIKSFCERYNVNINESMIKQIIRTSDTNLMHHVEYHNYINGIENGDWTNYYYNDLQNIIIEKLEKEQTRRKQFPSKKPIKQSNQQSHSKLQKLILSDLNKLRANRIYSVDTLIHYFEIIRKYQRKQVEEVFESFKKDPKIKSYFPFVNQEQIQIVHKMPQYHELYNAKLTHYLDLIESIIGSDSQIISLKKENAKLKTENNQLKEKLRLFNAKQYFPQSVIKNANNFTKTFNQYNNKHVPVIYLLAGQLTNNHYGIKIGRTTNLEARLRLYDNTLNVSGCYNLWKSNTPVQGYALFTSDTMQNNLTVAYINQHINPIWYNVEAIFRNCFKLQFAENNIDNTEWFDFGHSKNSPLFEQTHCLFNQIALKIAKDKWWINLTPSQIRYRKNKLKTYLD